MQGWSAHTNEGNGFRVIKLHYSADPSKDEAWALLNRKRYPPDKWDQEFELKRTASTLLVWPGFSEDIHVFEDSDFVWYPHYHITVGIDPGFDHPFAAVFVVTDSSGNAWVVDEHVARATLVSEHVHSMLAKVARICGLNAEDADSRWLANRVDWCIDPSQAQIIHELSQFGIYALRSPVGKSIRINDVGAGVNRVAEWLVPDERGFPRLRFLRSRTRWTRWEIGQYQWARTPAGIPRRDTVRKVNDDAVDALRYALMSRPRPARSISSEGDEDNPWLLKNILARQRRRLRPSPTRLLPHRA